LFVERFVMAKQPMSPEDIAASQLVPIIREMMSHAKINFILQANGLWDTPEAFFAVSKALQIVSDEEYELGTK
jgi:hypothetical protein